MVPLIVFQQLPTCGVRIAQTIDQVGRNFVLVPRQLAYDSDIKRAIIGLIYFGAFFEFIARRWVADGGRESVQACNGVLDFPYAPLQLIFEPKGRRLALSYPLLVWWV